MSTAASSHRRWRTPKDQAKGASILVATAGDAASQGALRLASAIAQRDKCTVIALSVGHDHTEDLSTLLTLRSSATIDDENRRGALDRLRETLESVPGAADWIKRAAVGPAADVINSTATAWRPSMIIVGLGRHTRRDQLFRSETAVAVMRRARVPVVAVEARLDGLPRHALAAIDFTPASMAAASLAADLLAEGGTITVAHVCAFGGATARPGDLVDVYRSGATAKLDEAVSVLRERTGRIVEGVMLDGHPAKAILEWAVKAECDLIALGGHEQSLMDRIVLGSVRTQVVRGARCSVLIAPPQSAD